MSVDHEKGGVFVSNNNELGVCVGAGGGISVKLSVRLSASTISTL